MMEHSKELSDYRISESEDALQVAYMCFEKSLFRDSINRSYYSIFYSIKAVLALEHADFKRHKDAINYFNKNFIALDIFPKALGRRIGQAKTTRETSDYNDFYIASKEDADKQLETAELLLSAVKEYLRSKN